MQAEEEAVEDLREASEGVGPVEDASHGTTTAATEAQVVVLAAVLVASVTETATGTVTATGTAIATGTETVTAIATVI